MKGNGNSVSTLFRKLYFFLLPTSGLRSRYVKKHQHLFHNIGDGIFFQPRNFPSDPELISIGNNVKIAADVTFINHDVVSYMLNTKFNCKDFQPLRGCIEIGNNVMIGAGVRILPNVRIGNNVIIGAGATVTKDIPDNSVAAGIPCKVIGGFDDFVKRRRGVSGVADKNLWEVFCLSRKG